MKKMYKLLALLILGVLGLVSQAQTILSQNVAVDATGSLLYPLTFFTANSNAIVAVTGTGGGGGTGTNSTIFYTGSLTVTNNAVIGGSLRLNSLYVTNGIGSQVNSIAALIAMTGMTNGQSTLVDGYYAPGDMGGGSFVYANPSTIATNLGLVFNSSVAGGQWIRVFKGDTSIRWFGAKGDNSTDDSAAFTNAMDVVVSLTGHKIYVPAGKYIISQTLQMPTTIGLTIEGEDSNQADSLGSTVRYTGVPVAPRNGAAQILMNTANTPIIQFNGASYGGLVNLVLGYVTIPAATDTNAKAIVMGSNTALTTIQNVLITNCGYGIYSPANQQSYSSSIRKFQVTQYSISAIDWEGGSELTSWENVYVQNGGGPTTKLRPQITSASQDSTGTITTFNFASAPVYLVPGVPFNVINCTPGTFNGQFYVISNNGTAITAYQDTKLTPPAASSSTSVNGQIFVDYGQSSGPAMILAGEHVFNSIALELGMVGYGATGTYQYMCPILDVLGSDSLVTINGLHNESCYATNAYTALVRSASMNVTINNWYIDNSSVVDGQVFSLVWAAQFSGPSTMRIGTLGYRDINVPNLTGTTVFQMFGAGLVSLNSGTGNVSVNANGEGWSHVVWDRIIQGTYQHRKNTPIAQNAVATQSTSNANYPQVGQDTITGVTRTMMVGNPPPLGESDYHSFGLNRIDFNSNSSASVREISKFGNKIGIASRFCI
jgi:hypothetical protein